MVSSQWACEYIPVAPKIRNSVQISNSPASVRLTSVVLGNKAKALTLRSLPEKIDRQLKKDAALSLKAGTSGCSLSLANLGSQGNKQLSHSQGHEKIGKEA